MVDDSGAPTNGLVAIALRRPEHRREAFFEVLIGLSEQENDVALFFDGEGNPFRQCEDIAVQERINVLPIQPDDEMLRILIVNRDGFDGHEAIIRVSNRRISMPCTASGILTTQMDPVAHAKLGSVPVSVECVTAAVTRY